MGTTDVRLTGVERARSRGVRAVTDDAEMSMIRARVRAMLEAHGGLVGESWDAQAEHAEEAVAEVIELQGMEAGRRWVATLEGQLRAERRAAGFEDPRAYRNLPVVAAPGDA